MLDPLSAQNLGGSIALPPFRLPGRGVILAGIARLRQNLCGGRSDHADAGSAR